MQFYTRSSKALAEFLQREVHGKVFPKCFAV